MRKSRISWHKQSRLIDQFLVETTARKAAQLVHLNRNTTRYYYHRLRLLIAKKTHTKNQEIFRCIVEIDETYCLPKPAGMPGRGMVGKIAVIGILARGGRVWAQVVDKTDGKTLLPIIRRKVHPDSIVFTDGYGAYEWLHLSHPRHHRINHRKEFARGRIHTNGIENFWRQFKGFLARFNGVPRHHFGLYLAEFVWRFNCSVLKEQKRLLKQWVREDFA